MNRSRYEVLTDGVGSTIPNKTTFRFACCDCGLVHDMVVVAEGVRKGEDLGFAVRRNKRATAGRRRLEVGLDSGEDDV